MSRIDDLLAKRAHIRQMAAAHDEPDDELQAMPTTPPLMTAPKSSSWSNPIGHTLAEVAEIERPPIRSYATGMRDLDRLLGGGISTRALTTVLGPPAAGKTAWCVDLSLHLHEQVPVLYLSTELEADELAARFAGHILGVPWRDIVRGRIEKTRVREALDGLRVHVVGCDELPRDNFAEVVASAVAYITVKYGALPVVIVDYLQDLTRGGDERNLRARVGDVATGLRALAQELDLAAVAVSSVSRAFYSARRAEELRSAQDPTAYLAAAKESGDVDYASAVVLFLDVEPAGAPAHRLAQVAVAKSRHGETGFAGARFYGATGRWEADAAAVAAMGDEGRADVKRAGRDRTNEEKLVATIRKNPKLAWKNLRAVSGISSYAEAEATRQRLADAGRITKLTEEYFDVLDRKQKRNVWRVVGDAPPEDSIEALAAKMYGRTS